jgi:hypothetical protein
MLAHEAAVVVQSGEELTEFVRCCIDRPPIAANLGERARQLVLEQVGATVRTLDLLESLVPTIATTDRPARAA